LNTAQQSNVRLRLERCVKAALWFALAMLAATDAQSTPYAPAKWESFVKVEGQALPRATAASY
jgi:hypothetical protein